MSESHDPWEDARARQREEVAKIFAKRAAAPVEDRRRDFRLSPRNQRIVGAVIALVVIACAIVIPHWRSGASREHAAQRAEQARLAAAERARIIRQEKPHTAIVPARRPGESVLAYRPRLVAAGVAAITADARARIKTGEIQGPVAGTDCQVSPDSATRRAFERDPAAIAGRYDCLAYERHFALTKLNGKARTGEIGQPYWLVINYKKPTLTFCKIVPRAGEGGSVLAFVPAPTACQDPGEKTG